MQTALPDPRDPYASFDEVLWRTVHDANLEAHEPGLSALVPAVDLAIAYRPVCPTGWKPAVVKDVRLQRDGTYLLVEVQDARPRYGRMPRGAPLSQWQTQVVDPVHLAVMRTRYLYRRGLYNLMLERDLLGWRERDMVIAEYFDGVWLNLPHTVVYDNQWQPNRARIAELRPLTDTEQQAIKRLPTISVPW